MGEEQVRGVGRRFTHGAFGALLAGLASMFVQFWLPQVHWWAVGVCAAVGFALAWFLGEEAIEILKTLFRWS